MLTKEELDKWCREQEAETAKKWARDQVKKRMEQVRQDITNAFKAWLKSAILTGPMGNWDDAREAEARVMAFLDETEKELTEAAEKEAN